MAEIPMPELVSVGLANAAMAVILAVPLALASRFRARPAVIHVLAVVVLAKLVTPPLVDVTVLPAPGPAPAPETMALARTGDNIVIVDQQGALVPGDMFDNLHPTQTGYEKMADGWFADLTDSMTGPLIKCR